MAGAVPTVCPEALHQLAKGFSNSVASKVSLVILCKFGNSHAVEEDFDDGRFRPGILDFVEIGVVFDAEEFEVVDPSTPGAVVFLESAFAFAMPDAIV